MILPGTGRGTIRRRANGGGGSSLHKPEVYAARKLRRSLSLPEALLWRELSGKRTGVKVRKQHPIGPYIVDFYVASSRLVIEVDGEAHSRGDRPKRDEIRDRYLLENGYEVARYSAAEVLKNREGVIASIVERMGYPLHHPSDGPPPRAGEDL